MSKFTAFYRQHIHGRRRDVLLQTGDYCPHTVSFIILFVGYVYIYVYIYITFSFLIMLSNGWSLYS